MRRVFTIGLGVLLAALSAPWVAPAATALPLSPGNAFEQPVPTSSDWVSIDVGGGADAPPVGERRERARTPGGENVIGRDGRFPVTDTTVDPYRQIGQIRATTPDGVRHQCTGTLVWADFVITAGQCLHEGRTAGAGWFSNVRFAAGRDGTSTPFGSCGATRLYASTAWVRRGVRSEDIGGIRLDCDMGNRTGWLGISSRRTPVRSTVEIPGYPTGRRNTLWSQTGPLASRSANGTLFYRHDTQRGQNGAPILRRFEPPGADPGIYVVGVHAYGTGLASSPCRCNTGTGFGNHQRMIQIVSWICDGPSPCGPAS